MPTGASVRSEALGRATATRTRPGAVETSEDIAWIANHAQDRFLGKEDILLFGFGLRVEPNTQSLGEGTTRSVVAAITAVILADEPSGNLDNANSERLHQLFAHLSREFETALVVVTHNRSLAGRADRVLSLEGGRLVPLSAAAD